MSKINRPLSATLEQHFAARMRRMSTSHSDLGYDVSAEDFVAVATELRDKFGFEMLIDVAGMDYLSYGEDEWKGQSATDTGFSRGVSRGAGRNGEPEGPRFAAVYQLLSVSENARVRLRVFCEEEAAPILPSAIDVWASADWYEREAFDLFGILFDGHPDLRRLLTDYGFIGHPFRKDFPLSGHVEVRYDPSRQRVVYEPVSIEPRTLVPKVIREDHRYDDSLRTEASFREEQASQTDSEAEAG